MRKMGLRTYVDIVAPDQPANPRSLIWELHVPLVSSWDPTLQISWQCVSLWSNTARICDGTYSHDSSHMWRYLFTWRVTYVTSLIHKTRHIYDGTYLHDSSHMWRHLFAYRVTYVTSLIHMTRHIYDGTYSHNALHMKCHEFPGRTTRSMWWR